jgi:uncharacterized membrane protein (UPF0127 family)
VAARQIERFDGLPRRELPGGLVVIEAETRRSRNLGLARLDELPADWGLHIPKCPAVHTFTMRFALDLLWLGRDGRVVRVDRDVAPARMRGCIRARSVVEVNAGRADAFVAAWA